MKSLIRSLVILVPLTPILFGGDSLSDDIGDDGGFSIDVLAKGVIERPVPSRWSIGGGFAPLVGVDAKFSGLGFFRNPLTPQALGGSQEYLYDNGFVRVDSSGNVGGKTWNWGYDDNSQYDSVGDSLEFSISNSQANGSIKESDDLSGGFEVFGLYDMGEIPSLSLGNRSARWGLKATLHYANISIGNSSSLTSGVSKMTDSFGLGGVLPPSAPYSGSFSGPGPLIGDSPIRTMGESSSGALVSGERDLEVHLFSLTVGPYLEYPITNRLSLSAEAGLSLALVSGEYDFSSSTSIVGAGTQNTTGSGDETSLLGGFSIGVNAIYRFNESWSGYGGLKYQYLEDFEIDAAGSSADLDFGSAFQFSLGAIYHF